MSSPLEWVPACLFLAPLGMLLPSLGVPNWGLQLCAEDPHYSEATVLRTCPVGLAWHLEGVYMEGCTPGLGSRLDLLTAVAAQSSSRLFCHGTESESGLGE